MSIIYKYTLFSGPGHNSSVIIDMPEEAQILSCQIQNGNIVVWALHNQGPMEQRYFSCFGTGLDIRYSDSRQHIATLQDRHGLVWHIFEEID